MGVDTGEVVAWMVRWGVEVGANVEALVFNIFILGLAIYKILFELCAITVTFHINLSFDIFYS
jgi:hypothetical protein